MAEYKSIVEQLTEFHKFINDVENIDMKIEDEDKVLHLLSSLSRSFKHVKDSLLYGKECTITLDEVRKDVKFKQFLKVKDLNIEDSVEGLSVSRGGYERRGIFISNRFDKLRVKFFAC